MLYLTRYLIVILASILNLTFDESNYISQFATTSLVVLPMADKMFLLERVVPITCYSIVVVKTILSTYLITRTRTLHFIIYPHKFCGQFMTWN